MHMIFTDEEIKWIETKKLGWPIKKGCPQNIKNSILAKKEKMLKEENDYGR